MTSASGATTPSCSAILSKLYYDGTIKNKLGEAEFKSYSWDKYEKGDPTFLFELLPRIANKEGELGTALGLGTGYHAGAVGDFRRGMEEGLGLVYWKMGHPKHHSNEDAGQCGVIINTHYNRDVQCHSHSNFTRNGLPIDVQKRLAAEIWGSAGCRRCDRGLHAHEYLQGQDGQMVPSPEGAS